MDRRTSTGTHQAVTSTGSHRAIGRAPRRRVAKWPIAVAVLVLLAGLGYFGWSWADSVLNSRAEAEAASCSKGDTTLRVMVAPSAEVPLAKAAGKWNGAKTVVQSHCVTVQIASSPSEQVLNALTGRIPLDTIGGLPAAWLPEASLWTSELKNAKPEMIGSPAASVASARSADYPYVSLAGAGLDEVHQRAAQQFRDFLLEPAQQADFTQAGLKATS
ncbi:hypothetical protein EWH70_11205 [Amycolatopsis suaedae]|uniref:Extracellular solute-binding protein n=1 Tax=Amycolatopsis suaedae TaxID=2510978 RepID=A0A4Q7J8G4_9PSEU|nr:hypothetical protein EWH70_11205 [Amycolatopsis suaedae]